MFSNQHYSSVMLFSRQQILVIGFVKVSFSSMVIPKSFSSLLHFICLFSIASIISLLPIFDLRNIIWNLPGFATMLLTLNQFNTRGVSLDSLRAACLWFSEREYMVVSLAKSQASVSWMKNINSFIKMLNKMNLV